MAISKYEENGQEYFKVYVHVRSPIDRTKRSQKYAYRIKTEPEARREEKSFCKKLREKFKKWRGMASHGLKLLIYGPKNISPVA